MGDRRLVDAALAALFAVAPPLFALMPFTYLGWSLSVAAALPLVFRRRRPVLAFAAILVVCAAAFPVGIGPFAAASLALFTVATAGPAPRWPSTGFVGGLTAACALALTASGSPGGGGGAQPGRVLLGLVPLGAAWTAGRAVAERRENAARAIERARLDERLRIAREMHDVVTHSMGLIAVRSAVANHLVDTHPTEARRALSDIEEISSRALGEMRGFLGVLRDDAPAPLRPQPGLADLHLLVEEARGAGVEVELTTRMPAPPPPDIDRTAYRVLQQALTNVAQHASPARCQVAIEANGAALSLRVTNPAAGQASPSAGYGLRGMRERVQTHGGILAATPSADGTFTLTVTLPYPTSG